MENYQHGEVVLHQISDMPKLKSKKVKKFVVAHSETGHHHVLEATQSFEVSEDEKHQLYVRLFQPAQLVHQKTTDFHPTLDIAPGIYKVFSKTEFDLWDDVIRDVKD